MKSRSKALAALRADRPAAKIIEGLKDAAAFAAGDESRARIVFPRIVFDMETDGRHIAEMPDLPGVMAYGSTQAEAVTNLLKIWRETQGDGSDVSK